MGISKSGMGEVTSSEDCARFEVLPFAGIGEEASRLPGPARVSVTCSPKHGPDHGVECGACLVEQGHALTVHVAARMVRDGTHLDALLAAMAQAGAVDAFVIGGDVAEPVGDYASAGELLALLTDHPRRPQLVGIAAYPEGHPLIADAVLEQALREKSRLADYVVTQMCFDPDVLRGWIVRQREQGMDLPIVVGMPGRVARHKLLAMAARIGVGPSMDFLRKQRGLRRLLSRGSTADRLFDDLAPLLDEAELAVVGFQYFTFNELVQTWEWHQEKLAARPRVPAGR